MSSRILIIGDPHFKENNAQETEEMCQKIYALLDEQSFTFIVVLGDVLDRHEKISLFALKRAIRFLEHLCQKAFTYCLIGNHDRPNNSTYFPDEHPFLACKQWSNLLIVDRPWRQDNLLFMPYLPPGKFRQEVESIEGWSEVELIFAHQEFSGARMGAIVSQAEEWPENYPMVISGHIHDYQEFPNLLYVGTPIQHGFNDREKKSLSLLEISEEKTELKRIYLDCRRKMIVHLRPSEIDSFQVPANVYLKIILLGSPAELSTALLLPQISLWKSQGIRVHTKTVLEERKKVENFCGYFATLEKLVAEDPLQVKWLEKLRV